MPDAGPARTMRGRQVLAKPRDATVPPLACSIWTSRFFGWLVSDLVRHWRPVLIFATFHAAVVWVVLRRRSCEGLRSGAVTRGGRPDIAPTFPSGLF
jgi:hypothetical protein